MTGRDHIKCCILFTAVAAGACSAEVSEPPRPIPNVGAKATASLTALPGVEVSPVGLEYGGTAQFSETVEGVDMVLEFAGCVSYKRYPLRIIAGDCASAEASPVWEGGRGTGITGGGCWGYTGRAKLFYSRVSAEGAAWSVGDGSASDLVGKSLVLYDPENPMRPLACGIISRVPGTPPDPATLPPLPDVRPEVRARLAGSCLGQNTAAGWDEGCPNIENLAECASMHCELDSCLRECDSYARCLDASPDACASECAAPEQCLGCMSEVVLCAVNGFCADHLACSPPPTPGGPCTELDACCMQQGERAETCLRFAHQLARQGGGDAACISFAQDADFMMNLIYDPVCTFSFISDAPQP